MMPVQLGSAYGKIVLDASGVAAGVASAQASMAGLHNSMMGMRQTLANVGQTLMWSVTLPLLGVGTAATKTVGDFEEQMNIMGVAARSSGTALGTLRDAAIAVGADTDLVGISASEAADAMTNFYKAGLDTTAIFGDLQGYLAGTASLGGALRSSIDLAAASELKLAQASDIVAISMATFGLGAEDAGRIADSFVQSADASIASVSDLAAAMVNVGPVAVNYGMSLEETNTALALLSERGIRGSEAGTALKSMLVNLTRPTDKVVSTLDALGVSLYDAEGNMRSLPNVIADLETAMSGLSEEQRNQDVVTLAGSYGMRALNTLLNEGAEGWGAMENSIANAATAQESAEARTKGFKAALEQLQGSFEALVIKGGTPFIENVLTPFVQRVTESAGAIGEQLDPKMAGLAITMGIVAAAAGPVLTILGALISPVGLVAAAVAGLGYAWATNFMGFRDAIAPVVETVSRIWEAITTFGKGALQEIVTFVKGGETNFTNLKAIWESVVRNVQYLMSGWIESLRAWGQQAWQWIQDAIPVVRVKVEEWASALVVAVQAQLPVWIESLRQLGQQAGAALWQGLQNSAPEAVQSIRMAFAQLQSFFGPTIERLKESVRGFVDSLST